MLAERLLRSEARVPLDGLAGRWRAARIRAVVPGHGPLAGEVVVMNRIRGAVGAVLMEGASAEAVAGQPCPWQPPCALDVLFREQGRIGGRHGLPKPWVLALDRRGSDLIVTLTLFGFAADWSDVVRQALAMALRRRIDWRDCAPGLFLPKPEIAGST